MTVEDITQLFGVGVTAAIADPRAPPEPLFEDEWASVSRAVPKRVREFAAGRACARAALGLLGKSNACVPAGEDRAPIWPTGYVGSISHCDDLCCAVASDQPRWASLGVDLERGEPLDPSMVALVCRPEELDGFRALPAGLDGPKLTFSAKEAFYKAYYPIAGVFLDFLDVSIRFAPDHLSRGSFGILLQNRDRPLSDETMRFAGRWMSDSSHVSTGVTLRH